MRDHVIFLQINQIEPITLAVISGKQLSCIKQDRILFEDVSFAVDAGDVLHIKGPNGAGKTSLLRIVVGLSQPDSGVISVHDQVVSKHNEQMHPLLVYCGHKPGLNQSLSAVENLRFWSELHGLNADSEVVYTLLEQLGLVGLEDLPVGKLSAGQQRRVALCRLWLKHDAPIWVLDEPFTALDVQGVALLQAHAQAHLDKRGCIVMTSHQDNPLSVRTNVLNLEYRI